jgi:hypothetical protein
LCLTLTYPETDHSSTKTYIATYPTPPPSDYPYFTEEALQESRGMMAFRGERMDLPQEERFMPSLEGLKWHRERWNAV